MPAGADKQSMLGNARSFSALVRWRSVGNRAWEIDTRHSGFVSAEEAAMAANGLGCGGFEKLVLERGDLFTIGVNGQRLQVEEEIAVWTMAAAPLDLPEDLQFERVDESPGLLSAKGLDGLFEARRFRVLDDETGRDVAVRFAVGRSRVVVLVGGLKAERISDVDVPRG
jgi:hypothetical protein